MKYILHKIIKFSSFNLIYVSTICFIEIKKYNYNWEVSSKKAIDELGYSITPFEKGAEQTIQWILNNFNHEK